MSDMMEYKCPACGGTMEFDSTLQKMKCPYCDTVMTVEKFQEIQKKEQEKHKERMTESTSDHNTDAANMWGEGETDSMNVYACQSCGGEIVVDETTGATTCPFCGNRVVMKEKFSGDLRPDYIIPFKKDKKAAKEAYYDHLKGKKFLPKLFKDENHIDEIKGVYVPFWLYDIDVEAEINYEGERVAATWRTGDKQYTKHEVYSVERQGTDHYEHVPADGSKNMEDALMESIEPFNFKDAVPFEPAYLAGYIADRYDVDQKTRLERVKERVTKSTEAAFQNTVTGYTTLRQVNSNVDIRNIKTSYALYPVWVLSTTWKDKNYIFAMNGQTGALIGDLPMDKGEYKKFIAIRTAIIGVILAIALILLCM